jgi:hypothetical protein
MASRLKPGWSKPSAILFATEIPADEKAFAFALAQAVEFGAQMILFHAYDTLVVAASETSGIRYYDYAAAAEIEIEHLAPLARRVRDAGVQCETVVRPGLAADQVIAFVRERQGKQDSLSRPHRQAAGGFSGRGRAAHRQGPGLHHRSGGCRRPIPQL